MGQGSSQQPCPTQLEQLYCLKTISEINHIASSGIELNLQVICQVTCRKANFEIELLEGLKKYGKITDQGVLGLLATVFVWEIATRS
jgi:hypothetical protein